MTIRAQTPRACPRCRTRLTTEEAADLDYESCRKCGGVLIQAAALQDLLDREVSAIRFPVGKPPREFELQRDTARCPCSDATMRTVLREGEEVDLCSGCGAMWFDGNEIHGFLEHSRTPSDHVPLKVLGARMGAIFSWLFFLFLLLRLLQSRFGL